MFMNILGTLHVQFKNLILEKYMFWTVLKILQGNRFMLKGFHISLTTNNLQIFLASEIYVGLGASVSVELTLFNCNWVGYIWVAISSK